MILSKQFPIKDLKNNYGMNPLLIEDAKKQELKGYDWATLRYLTLDYLQVNKEYLGLFDVDWFEKEDEAAAIQDNALYLGGFEGYRFGPNYEYVLHCTAFNQEHRFMGLIEKEDEQGNELWLKWYLLD